MKFLSPISSLLLWTFASSNVDALARHSQEENRPAVSAKTRQLKRTRLQSDLPERSLTKPCTLYLVEKQDKENIDHWYECELHPEDNFGKRGHIVKLNMNLPETFKDRYAGSLESGETELYTDDALIIEDKLVLRGQPTFSRKRTATNGRRLEIVGDRKVLVVRVEASDSVTTSSEEDLAREIFGIKDSSGNGDSFNLSSGYKSCSHGKLTFSPASHDKLNNGVYTVKIPNFSVNGKQEGQVKDAIMNKLEADFEDFEQFDHLMLCIPPGTGSWAAYAYVGGFISVYNDKRCTYPSAQIHEIGHNLGLKHSNEDGNVYHDQSGLMGFSYAADDAPVQCFNNVKHWQLGWYADKHVIVNPLEENEWEGDLVGFVDYDTAGNSKDVILKIEGHNKDYFIGFNRRSGMNRGNAEVDARDKVTIQSVGAGTNGESNLEAKLDIGETFLISHFGGTDSEVFVKVENIDFNANPPYATISVRKPMCSSNIDCDDNSSCTTDTCNTETGRCVHTPNDKCAGFMEMVLLTDQYPNETKWRIIDNCKNNDIVMSGEGYKEKFTAYEEKGDFLPSQYTFEIEDTYGDGICCGQGSGKFALTYNEEIVIEGGDFGKSTSITWGSCQQESCDLEFDLNLQKGDAHGDLSWRIENHGNSEKKAGSEGFINFSSTNEIQSSGCLSHGCYRLVVENDAGGGSGDYSFKVNEKEIIFGGAGDFHYQQITLFGTCDQ